jgi:hypothetical protein
LPHLVDKSHLRLLWLLNLEQGFSLELCETLKVILLLLCKYRRFRIGHRVSLSLILKLSLQSKVAQLELLLSVLSFLISGLIGACVALICTGLHAHGEGVMGITEHGRSPLLHLGIAEGS